jgi:transforming growth factor-beta-induced protein
MKFAYILTAVASVASAADSVEVAAQSAGLTTLLAVAQKVNLTSIALALTNVTIFAPTNQAFQDLDAFAKKNNITLTNELLIKVLQLHIVPMVVSSSAITSSATPIKADTRANLTLTVSISNGKVTVASPGNVTATVVTADVIISQGILHVIDKVLLPDLSKLPIGLTNGTGNPATGTGVAHCSKEFLCSFHPFVY